MRYNVCLSLLLLSIASLCIAQSPSAQSKKRAPSAMLASAQFVFVEPYSGTDTPAANLDPQVSAEDREAVANVQNAILGWGQYQLAARRSEANLIVFIRKGRVASGNAGVRVHVGTSNPAPGAPTQTGSAAAPLGGAEVGPAQDIFWVYSLDPDGKLSGPVWQKTLKDGLVAPHLILFEKFKEDVAVSVAAQAKNQSAAKKTIP
jgi:hypothetical protein